jgi:SAM-dependent methyltransferase
MNHDSSDKTSDSDPGTADVTRAVDAEALETELEAQKQLALGLRTKLEAQSELLQDLTRDLDEREREIAQIKRSTSWIVTAPVRAVVTRVSRLLFRKERKLKRPRKDIRQAKVSNAKQSGLDHAVGIAKRKGRTYQSLEGRPGSSDSQAKLERLLLERLKRTGAEYPLEGFSVLDVGCNEGFFCNVARELGATRVVGIDRSAGVIELARQRFPDITFIHGSWWEVPEERFDVILFLSAIHYEPEQKRLLDFLATRLKPGGTLVLECGVVRDPHRGTTAGWRAIERSDGLRRYPTLSYLREALLASYAVRAVGPSVSQKGDPIPRTVLHCTPRRPVALLISGESKSGKSTLADLLHTKGILTYSTDSLFSHLVTNDAYFRSDLSKWLRKRLGPQRNWSVAAKLVVEHAREQAFSEQVVAELPFDNTTVFVVEGEALRHDKIRCAIHQALQERGVIVWIVERPPSIAA